MNSIIEKFLMFTIYMALCVMAAMIWMILGIGIYCLVAYATGL